MFLTFDLQICFAPQRRAIFLTSAVPKVAGTWCVLCILTYKCTSRHFVTSTFPKLVQAWCVFYTFNCKCVSRHSSVPFFNFQKWSENVVFCAFWLENVLRAKAACNFSFLIWPGVSAPAAFASLLFVLPDQQIIGKTQCFATFLTFRAPVSSFFWLFPFLSATPVFHPFLLCFSSLHIVGS